MPPKHKATQEGLPRRSKRQATARQRRVDNQQSLNICIAPSATGRSAAEVNIPHEDHKSQTPSINMPSLSSSSSSISSTDIKMASLSSSSSSISSTNNIEYSNIAFHEELGEGSFGIVHRVTFETPFKGYKEAASKSVTHLQQGEVRILTNLQHANIVKLLGVYRQKPVNILLLEYAKNGSLHDYLKRDPTTPLPDDLIEKWTRESALALKFLHANNVIHRDIKASNCLLFEENVLKLTDFGLAREMDHSQTTSTAQKGTYSYMAPEIIKAKGNTNRSTYSKRTDIYAYGMLTLEICTRRVPYEGKEWQYITYNVATGNLKPTVPANCPEKLAHIMKRCWQLDPKQRPGIDDIVQDLTTCGAAAFHIQHWSLEKEFSFESEGLLAHRAACCPNGDIVVAYQEHNRLYLINADGTYKQDMKKAEDQEPISAFVTSLAVTSQGKILARDANWHVLVFDINGMQLPSFSTLTDDEDPNTEVHVSGVCVDRDDNILVQDVSRSVITIHEPDGQIMDEIHMNANLSAYECITVNSKKHILHYSDVIGKHAVVLATNYECEILFTIFPAIHDSDIVIRKVVLDSDDNIYVAMCEVEDGEAMLNTGHIHKYNSQGVFLECIAQGLYYPRDMSITSDGSLVIANQKSILIYSYK